MAPRLSGYPDFVYFPTVSPHCPSPPYLSAKEWHRQNKQVLRTNATDVYVPTEEDRVEANAKKEREMSRKRQDLRNNHPFLMLSKKERESEIEDHYDNRYDVADRLYPSHHRLHRLLY